MVHGALLMNPIFYLIHTLLSFYSTVVFVMVILDLLVYFNVVNPYQPLVQKIRLILFKLTDPVLSRIRKFLPDFGGIDLSPVLLLIGIQFIQYTIVYYS